MASLPGILRRVMRIGSRETPLIMKDISALGIQAYLKSEFRDYDALKMEV
jgi:hypothetical protein